MLADSLKNVDLAFYFRHIDRYRDFGRKLIDKIFEIDGNLSPEIYEDNGNSSAIDQNNIEGFLNVWEKSNTIHLRRYSTYESEIAINLGFTGSKNYQTFLMWINEKYFTQETSIKNFLKFSISLYEVLTPDYGSIHQTNDAINLATVQHVKFGKTVLPIDLKKGLPNIYWANFFSPVFVDLIGKQKLLDAPVYERMDLPNGGLLLITSPSPLNPESHNARLGQQALKKALGEEHFRKYY